MKALAARLFKVSVMTPVLVSACLIFVAGCGKVSGGLKKLKAVTVESVELTTPQITHIISEGSTLPIIVNLGSARKESTVVVLTLSSTRSDAAQDFFGFQQSLTIPAGDVVGSATFSTVDDSIFEGTENFTLIFSSSDNGIKFKNPAITVVVNDNDSAPVVSLTAATQTVSESAGTANVVAQLDHASQFVTVVSISSTNGTATQPADYSLSSTLLTIPALSTSATISPSIVNDSLSEASENFQISLTGLSGTSPGLATIGAPATQTITITDDDAPPTISIANATLAEGNSGSSSMSFVVTASAVSNINIVVNYATSDGTATTADSDYTSASGTVTIVAGATSTTFTVPILGDTVFENNETLTATLSGGSGYTVAGSTFSATGTITNDDSGPTISIANVSQAEGNAGSANLTFTVTSSAVSALPVVVLFSTADSTATTADSDYASGSGTVTIAAGSTTTTFNVSVNGDTKYETNETFGVTLSGGSGYTSAGSTLTATGTITNDDSAPTISIADVSQAEGNSGTSDMVFTVTSSAVSALPVTVTYATSNGTATTANSDYNSATGTLTIAAGATTGTFAVVINGDTVYESDETLNVTLSAGAGYTVAGSTLTAVGTIQNDEGVPTLSIANASVTEGTGAGTTTASFVVTMSGTSASAVTVDYATSDASATAADNDFTTASSTLTIAAGSTTGTINIDIGRDAKYEVNETFKVDLTNPSGAAVSVAQGTGTITNDDTAPTLSIADVTVTEGTGAGTTTAAFVVSLSAVSGTDVTFDFATVDGTATVADSDFTSTSGTSSIAAGATTATVNVTIDRDAKFESDETFNVDLTNPTGGATFADNSGVGTITNDDSAPTIAIAAASVAEGNSGTSNLTFTVTASAISALPITVAYATSNNTATVADSDYAAASGTLTIAAGSTTSSITVVVNGDTKSELDETLDVTLSGGANYTAAGSTLTAVGTITNDDVPPTISIANVSLTEGNSGTSNMTFTITSSAVSAIAITVDYASANGTALIADSDYSAVSGTATIAAGSTSTTFNVSVNGDAKFETDETLGITLSGGAGYTVAGSTLTATGTITNDDTAPTISIANVSLAEGNAGTSNMGFTVTSSAVSGVAITVDYISADSTATTGDSDYAATSGTLTIAAGSTTAGFNAVINGDTKFEADETFTITLSGGAGYTSAGSTLSATGTITNDESAPTLSIADVSQAEGNSGSSNMTFTVTSSAVSAVAITVNYATANATATVADSDYSALSGTATIAAGSTTATFNVVINGDAKDESDETFGVTLSGGAGYTVAGSTLTATGTITNDDSAPTISVADVSLAEGNSGTSNMTFTVTASAVSGVAMIVNYASSNGTATLADSDYASSSGTVTIAVGATTATFNVVVNGDAKYEVDENLTVTLSGGSGYTVAGSTLTATGTITNDDTAPTISIADVSLAEGNSGTSNMTFAITSSAVSAIAITVSYASSNGTATVADGDYAAASGTATIAAGSTTASFNVVINGDAKYENDETLGITLSGGAGYTAAGSTLTATGTITNDDTAPTISIADVSQAEGNSGTSNMTFTITASAVSALPITVDYATANNTATTAGNDYNSASGTATIAAGATVATFNVVIKGDATYEADETFDIALSGGAGYTAAGSTLAATGTIQNDEGVPSLAIANASVTEGTGAGTTTAAFVVTMSGVSGTDVTVDYATSDGTAKSSDSDYTTASSTLTISAGQTTGTISITIGRDAIYEVDETFKVDLSNPLGAAVGTAQGTGTITNDDTAPTISIADLSVAEGTGAGTTTAAFVVTLSAASGTDVTVDFATANGTATLADSDYTSTSGTTSISAGTTSATINVTVGRDAKFEVDETFNLDLSNATGGPTILDNSGVATITNDDTAPTISIADVSLAEGNSGTSNMTFTITSAAVSGVAVTVDYASANGTATVADSDYSAASGTATIPAGSTTATFNVVVNGDTKFEGDETLGITLSGGADYTAAGSTLTATGTITNDDTSPTLSIADVSLAEGNSGTSNMTFTITASAASGVAITVDYASANGTATVADSDYAAASGTATIAAGSTTATFNVVVNGDTKYESNETIGITLSGGAGYTVAGSTLTATGTITNDDSAPTISIADVSLAEGNSGAANMTFTVTSSAVSAIAVVVDYASGNGTATLADSDYTVAGGTVTIAAGATTATFNVGVNGDSKYESDETFGVTLSNGSGYTVAGSTLTATGTITNDDTAPTISIANVSQAEGNAATSNATFTVTASAVSGVVITVDYASADSTATTADSDYTAASGTVTIAAGSTTATFNVVVNGDTKNEASETYGITLSGGAGYTSAGSTLTATGTITNDDTAPTISIANVSQAEGNSGTANATFTVTSSAVSGEAITVDYASADSTATTADSDYTAASGTLTIAAGSTTATFNVVVSGDAKYEANETYDITLSGGAGYTAAGSTLTATGTITNDDTAPTLAIADVTVTEGTGAGTTTANLVVTLSAVSGVAVTFDYATADSTATTADSDYTTASGTATIAVGATVATVGVTVGRDAKYEVDETFSVGISNATGTSAVTDNTGVASITNDDTAPTISIANVSQAEANSGTANMTFTVTASAVSGVAVVVDYATSDGTATTADSDYASATGTVTIAAGSTTATYNVVVNGDALNEANETFTNTLSGGSGYTSAGSTLTATGTITNDDAAPTVQFTAASSTVDESVGTKDVVLQLSEASGQSVVVPYTINVSSTATGGGTDYSFTASPLTIAAGATTATIVFTIVDDAVNDTSESVIVDIGTPTNATASGNTTYTLTINDTDLSAFTISGVTGNTDVTADAYLNTTLNPVIAWAASTNATSYDVTVYENDGTTVKCALQNTASTSYDFSACTLTTATNYKAKVTAKSATQTLDASNSLFSFYVNRPPTPVDDGVYFVLSGGSITISPLADNLASGGADPDTDPDTGDTALLIVAGKTDGTLGTVTYTSSTVVYTPTGSNTGLDTFTYTVSDTHGGTATGTVTVRIVTAFTWTGAAGDRDWATNGNWCGALNANKTACSNGGVEPTSATNTAHVAIFDDTCVAAGSGCSPNLNSNANYTMYGLYIKSGYAGTVTQAATKAMTIGVGGISQAAGTFVGSSGTASTNDILSDGNLIISGGSFTNTAGKYTVRGNNGSTISLTVSGTGTYLHNNGTLQIGTNDYYDKAVNWGLGSTHVYNLNLNIYSTYRNIATTTDIHVDGTLTVNGAGCIDGTSVKVYAYGDVNVTATHPCDYSGSATQLVLAAPASTTQTITGVSTAQVPGKLVVNAAGTVRFRGTVNVNQSFEMIAAASVDTDTSTVRFSDASCCGTNTVTPGSIAFNNVEFGATNKYLTLAGNMTVKGNLTFSDSNNNHVNGSQIDVYGHLYASGTGSGGTTNLRLLQDAGTPASPVIDTQGKKVPGGTLTIDRSVTTALASALNLQNSGQDLVLTAGAINMSGYNLTVIDQLTMAAGTSIDKGCTTLTEVGGAVAVGAYTRHSSNGTVTGGTATPSISIADVSVNEGNSGNTAMAFVVTTDAPYCGNLTMVYNTSNGSATSGSDYTAASSQTLTIASATVGTITINATGDTTAEGNETFNLTLSSASAGSFSDNVAVGTIVNDDTNPYMWTGAAGDGNWDTAGNWSGGAKPNTSQVAIFNNLCTNCNVTTQTNAVDVGGIRMDAGYTGTITQLSDKKFTTRGSGFVMQAGTFLLNQTIESQSHFNITGGTFTAASGTLVDLIGTGAGCDSYTLNTNGAELQNLTFRGGCDGYEMSASTATVNGTLTLKDQSSWRGSLNNGTVIAKGPIALDNYGMSGSGLLKIAGSSSQVVSITGSNVVLPDTEIASTGGTVTISGVLKIVGKLTHTLGTTTISGTSLTVTSEGWRPSADITVTGGTLNFNSTTTTHGSHELVQTGGTVNITNNASFRGVNSTGGIFNATTANITFPGGSCSVSNAKLGSTTVANLTFSGGCDGFNHGGTTTVTGDLTLNDTSSYAGYVSGGTIEVGGNVVSSNYGKYGTVKISLVGTGTQTINSRPNAYWGTSTLFPTGDITINKPSGTVVMTSAMGAHSGSQKLIMTAGTLDMGGYNLTVTGQLTMAAGTVIYKSCGTLTETGGAVSAGSYTRNTSSGYVYDGKGVTLTMSDPSVTEGDSGTANMDFVVTASGAQCGAQVTTFSYATSNGTATTANSDYVSASGTATIPNGSTLVTITALVNGDTSYESDETFAVTISSATNGIISDNSGTGTITNDDAAPTISIANASVTEGNSGTATMTFTITASGVSASNIVVDYASSDGTAASASDYTALSGTATIAAGSTTTTFDLTVSGDTLYEAGETVTLTLSGGSGYTSAGSTLTATGTITNDDTAPTLTVADVSATEGSALAFVVTQSAVTGADTTFNYATSNWTADSASDYTSASSSATIAAGATLATISVTTADDNLDETSEKVWFTLSSVVNATGPGSPAAGTIKDATLNFNFMRGSLPSGLTFTRGTTATYWGRDGLLKSAAINTPRFEYDPVTREPKGLLFEDYAYNRLQRSEDLSNAAWTKQGLTLSSNAIAAPDGATTADLLTEDSAGGAHNFIQSAASTANTVHTISVFVKPHASNARRYFQLTMLDSTVTNGFYANFDLQNEVVESSGVSGSGAVRASGISPVGNGWYRVYVSGIVDASSTSFYYAVQFLNNSLATGYVGNGASALYFWGMQLEDEYLMSSYIPTTTGGVTRSSDVMSVNSFSSYYDDAGWTFSMDFQKQFFEPSTMSFARAFGAICKSSGCTSDGYLFEFNASTTQLRLRKRVSAADAGTSVVTITPSSSTIFQFVVSKSSQGTTTVNGTSGSASTGSLPTGIDTMYIGGHNVDRGLNGHIRRASFRPRTFTNTQAQAITTDTTPACPYGYVPVPKNSVQYNADFCVAQYEMRQVNSAAMSQAATSPWVTIARGATSATASSAWKACADLGVGYNLISNDQWQTTARDIVGVTSNWSSGVVGSGYINRGHSDSNPASVCDSTVANVTTDCSTSAGGGFADQLRTHTLSNSSTIWDFGGNIGEWVSDDDSTAYGADAYVSQVTDVTHSTTGSDGRAAKARFGPSQDFSALNSGTYGGLGYNFFATPGGAIARGHDYSQGGVFSSYHAGASTTTSANIGFRCVFEP